VTREGKLGLKRKKGTICHWASSHFPYVKSIPFYMGYGKWELAQ
jgi:hypothetical protein